LAQRTADTCDVTLLDEKRRKSGKQPDKAHGQSISTPEMATHALGLPTVFSSFDAVHVNTSPPEERYVTLKRFPKKKTPTTSEPSPTFGVRSPMAADDPNSRCGSAADGTGPLLPSREPTAGQVRAYYRQQNSRYNPDQVRKSACYNHVSVVYHGVQLQARLLT